MADQRTTIYQGRIIRLDVESVTLPNGAVAELEIVHHPGGAAAVALDENGNVCLLRQYRHAAAGWLWELPAGKLDAGEAPLTAAQRELEEEAGVRATHWAPLGKYLSSPGVFTETLHLFLAQGLVPTTSQHEAHELIEVHWLPFDKAVAMAHAGEILDGKTVIGLLRAQHQLSG